MTQQFNTLVVEDVYKQWGQKVDIYSGADRVVYWHNDSEITSLTLLDDGDYRIEYADDTWDIVSAYAIVSVQSIQWKY